MSDRHDALETRDPALREREQFARMPEVIIRAMRAPGWAKHLAGIDPKSVTSRAALAKLPVLRKSDIAALQKENPPFGGLNATPANRAKRLLMSPGPIFEPEGEGKDWWGAARACFAAGFRLGDIVHNSFAYHLTPGGFILESGCQALGCAVIPGGVGNTEQQLEAIAHYKPSGYVGTPDFLKILLDTAEKTGKDVSSIKRALVSGGALPGSLRDELGKRGVVVLQCYATAEWGVIAYESEAPARFQAEWEPVSRPESAPAKKLAQPAGYANQPRSHNAVAAAVAQSRAAWGVAIEPVARMYGLAFLPIAPEEYDFLLLEARRERPAVQAFLAVLRHEATRARIRALGMEPSGE